MTQRTLVSISDAELQRRHAAVLAGMAERGLDAIVMQNTNDWLGGYVKWFTDHPATNGYPRTVILHKAGDMSVVEMGVFDGRRGASPGDVAYRGVTEVLTTPSFLSIVYTIDYDARLAMDILRARGARQVAGLCPGAWPAAFARMLQDGLGDGLQDATDWVDVIKAVKSPEEINLIQQAAALQDAVFARVAANIRPGMRDIDVTALAQHEGLIFGSEQGIFLGGSAPIGHASPFLPRHMQGRTLAEGDHLSLLIEINGPGGFYTEIARTLVLGHASAQLQDMFAAMKDSQDHTLSLLKPSVLARDVAAAHDAYMTARGMPAETRLYAHGQGYDMVERPLIRRDETMAIAEIMCLAAHSGVLTDWPFAVICDNYLIGRDGPGDCLHKTEKRLFEV